MSADRSPEQVIREALGYGSVSVSIPPDVRKAAAAALAVLLAELETLRKALQAIADPQSWKHGDPSPGERARAGLAGSTPSEPACTCQGVYSEHGYVVSHGPDCTLDQRSRREA